MTGPSRDARHAASAGRLDARLDRLHQREAADAVEAVVVGEGVGVHARPAVRELQAAPGQLVGGHHPHRHLDRPDPRRHAHRVAVGQAQSGGVVGVHLQARRRRLVGEPRDVVRAAVPEEQRARARHEHEGVLGVRRLEVGRPPVLRQGVVAEFGQVRRRELDLARRRREALDLGVRGRRAVHHPLGMRLELLQREAGGLEQPAVQLAVVLPGEVLPRAQAARQVAPELVLGLHLRVPADSGRQRDDPDLVMGVELAALQERGGREDVVGERRPSRS